VLTHLLFSSLLATSGAQPCYIDGVPEMASCHQIAVAGPTKQGKTQQLRVVVLPALGVPQLADPLFIFAGGPGQAASEYGALVTRGFARVRARRDVVLIDQRGTGVLSGLPCALGDGNGSEMEQMVSQLLDCRSKWHTDISLLTTAQAARDTETVRATLGYQKINLWGGSYGTRLAQEYMRRYPMRVRTAVLDGVAPPMHAITVPAERYAWEAFQRIDEACQAQRECAQQFGNSKQRLQRLLTQSSDQNSTLNWRSPIHAGAEARQVNASDWLAVIRGAMYSRSGAQALPYALKALEEGHVGPLLALGASASWASDSMTLGQTMSVICADDHARVDAGFLAAPNPNNPFHASYAKDWLHGCARWQVPHSDLSVAISEVPSLLLSGGFDPVTPPHSAEQAMPLLAKAQHLIAAQAAHGVSHVGCAPKLIAQFIDEAGAKALDGSCLDRIASPPFLLDGSAFVITAAPVGASQ
jgi:pimeloyl-ACP methyl ester carboxylesterase